MVKIFAGTAFDTLPSPAALAGLGFAELAPRAPLPKALAFARWRRRAPEANATLVAPRRCWASERGPLRDPQAMNEGLEWLAQASDAAGCWGIVLPTGADLTVGQRDRTLLADFVAALRERTSLDVIWAPGGLWEQEDAVPQAEKMGAVCAFDPLEETPPPGAVAYGRVQALGARPRLTPGHLEQIAASLAGFSGERAYVSLLAQEGVRAARQLQLSCD